MFTVSTEILTVENIINYFYKTQPSNMKTDLNRLYKIQIISYISVETPQQGENTISFKEASDKMIPILHAFSCILVIYKKQSLLKRNNFDVSSNLSMVDSNSVPSQKPHQETNVYKARAQQGQF